MWEGFRTNCQRVLDHWWTWGGGTLLSLVTLVTGVWFDAKVVGVIAAVVIFTLGIAFAQFQAWQEMWREKSRLQKIVNGSGLVFRCGDGPPYHEITENGRHFVRIQIHNSTGETRRSVRLSVIAAEGGRAETLPIALRVRGKGVSSIDLMPYEDAIFDIAKIVPTEVNPTRKDGIFLCNADGQLSWINRRKARIVVRSYVDGFIGREAAIELERTADEKLIGRLVHERDAEPSYDILMPRAAGHNTGFALEATNGTITNGTINSAAPLRATLMLGAETQQIKASSNDPEITDTNAFRISPGFTTSPSNILLSTSKFNPPSDHDETD